MLAAFDPPPSLAVDRLRLERGGRTLIGDLSLRLERGDALALGGPNGSGKTSLLRALAGLLRPAAGAVRVDGAIALLGHADALKSAETVARALKSWAAIEGGDPARFDAVTTDLAIAHLARRPTGALSAGQRRRVALARIVLSNRPVWLLDEPAAPLDRRSHARLSDLTSAHRGRGGLVIAATHLDLGWPDLKTLELGA